MIIHKLLLLAIVLVGMTGHAQKAIIKNVVGTEIIADHVLSIDGNHITYLRENSKYSIYASSITYSDGAVCNFSKYDYSAESNRNYKTGKRLTVTGFALMGVSVASGIGAIIQSNQGNKPTLLIPSRHNRSEG